MHPTTLYLLVASSVLLSIYLMGNFSASSSPPPLSDKFGSESLMRPKEFGTCNQMPKDLRWGVDDKKAIEICCFNRHFAEHSSYFLKNTNFMESTNGKVIEFFDSSNPSLMLFRAPVNRSMHDFVQESKQHGWPSFREDEVIWENVRVLKNGETVSIDGTHLGHNIPDGKGNRYCINLVSVAGNPHKEM